MIFDAGADTITLQAGSGRAAVLTFRAGNPLGTTITSDTTSVAYVRQAGASILIRGTNLGGTVNAADTTSVNFLTKTPALTGVGGGTGITRGIMQGVIADSVINGVDTYGIATYEGTTTQGAAAVGIRRLNETTEYAANITSGGTALNNVRLVGASDEVSAATTINSLFVAGGGSIDGVGTLTVNSGTVLSAGGANSGIGTTIAGTLAFPGEAIFYTVNDLAIGSTLTGASGLTKGGAGTLTLRADNSAGLSGGVGITVNGGLVAVGADSGLGAADNVLRLNNGGGLQATASFASARSVVLGNAGGVVDVSNASDTLTLSGAITDNLGTTTNGIAANTGTVTATTMVLTKTGAGRLEISGVANTYTGATTVNGGTLAVSGSIRGSAGLVVNSGATLLLGAANNTSSTALVSLNGGKLAIADGLGDTGTSSNTETFGALTLSGNATLDFGIGAGVKLSFAALSSATDNGAILSITNWSGAAFTEGGNGSDRLLFAGNVSDFTSLFGQNEVFFDGGAGYQAISLGAGAGYEIVAIPEPSSLVSAFLALGLVRWRARRREGKSARG